MNAPGHPIIDSLLGQMQDMRSTVDRKPRNTWSTPSTPHQRLYIRTMFGQLDLDTRYMTAFHRRFFDAANLPHPTPNASIDAVLCGLSRTQASALIDAVKKEVPRED